MRWFSSPKKSSIDSNFGSFSALIETKYVFECDIIARKYLKAGQNVRTLCFHQHQQHPILLTCWPLVPFGIINCYGDFSRLMRYFRSHVRRYKHRKNYIQSNEEIIGRQWNIVMHSRLEQERLFVFDLRREKLNVEMILTVRKNTPITHPRDATTMYSMKMTPVISFANWLNNLKYQSILLE